MQRVLGSILLLCATVVSAFAQQTRPDQVTGGIYLVTPPVYSDKQTTIFQTDASGNIKINCVSGCGGAGASGATPYHLVAAASNNSVAIATGARTLYGVEVFGVGAAPAYLKFYDKASAPTCASDAVVKQIMIPAAATAANGAGAVAQFPAGVAFTLGVGICVVAGIADNDNTSVAAATFIINVAYK